MAMYIQTAGKISHGPVPSWPSPQAIIFRSVAFLVFFGIGSMTSQNHQLPLLDMSFRLICINCNGVGIVFDCSESAPAATPIKCSLCGAPRGTLGELRRLSDSDQSTLFDV
jgi:hypothetical protein